MGNNKKHKTKRQQPRPKKKTKPTAKKAYMGIGSFADYIDNMRTVGKSLVELLKDKEKLADSINTHIKRIEEYFKKYDSIQLLGSTGLYLLDNLATLEKYFVSQISGKKLELDEDAEVIAEYALNFGLSLSNEGKEDPTEEVITDLRETLRMLARLYGLIDMPLEDNANQWITWVCHSETISVRGDGYQCHVEEVFKELFYPHSDFFESEYGFTAEELFEFCHTIEDRVICKIGSQDIVYGAYKMHQRWVEWDKRKYGDIDDMENLLKRDFSKGMFGDFFEENPDCNGNGKCEQFLCYQPDDFGSSEIIFWVVPQTDSERAILASLSSEFGSNSQFIAEGEYKGNVMNGHSIFEKPFVKDGDRYYCFTPMLVHRNLFLIAEKLIMRNQKYYQTKFQQNTCSISRDNFIEHKVREVLESFLPTVEFHSSVKYHVTEEGELKHPELDIIGLSDKATYIIEVKAHELTHKDRVGVVGMKYKFDQSVGEACRQCQRALTSVCQYDDPEFTSSEGVFKIDKSKPVYKIAVTFQHYSTLLGDMRRLIEAGMLKEEYRDTWIISLFDLMVISEFVDDEDMFIRYLETHKIIYQKDFEFFDEIDLLNGFVNYDLELKVKQNESGIIRYGTKEIDDEYSKDYQLPISATK